VFKLSKFSVWPLYFIVNELPFKLRYIMENVILEQMKLEQDGVEVRSPLHACPFVSKVIVLAGTCDLPAKCLVLNTIPVQWGFWVPKMFTAWSHFLHCCEETYSYLSILY